MNTLSALLIAQGLWPTVLALGPGGGAVITWHPNGCGNNDGDVQLANPGDVADAPPCIMNDFGFPNDNPAGGWEVQNMPDTVSFEVRQGPRGGDICGEELILQVANNGCYDLPSLANTAWWDFCETGRTCSEPQGPPAKRAASKSTMLRRDTAGDYMIAANGERIPILRQRDVSPAALNITGPSKRQSTTFSPPSSCFLAGDTCQGFANINDLEADCVDCVTGFGTGVRASASIDCRASSSDCPITFDSSITVTDTWSEEISFGATIGVSGDIDGEVGTTFSWGFSFSVATEKGQSLGLLVPAGSVGFAQYQPPALLGSVVSAAGGLAASVNNGEVTLCSTANGFDGNLLCGISDGIIATDNTDESGQYSIVTTA